MATRSAHYGRPGIVLLSLCIFVALLFGIMAGTRTWSPKLGLDLQGGMTITLTATNPTVTQEAMDLAVAIMQQRVDGLGVGEASVTTMGDRNIIVSAPNVTRDDLVELVGATAQLEFRPVLAVTFAGPPSEPNKANVPPLPRPEGGVGELLPIDEVLAYQPSAQDQQKLADHKCEDPHERALDQAQVVCDLTGQQKLLLGPVAVQGKSVQNAQADIPQGTLGWAVQLQFDAEGTERFSQTTTRLVRNPEPTNQFAIVLDGKARSFPRVESAITNGEAQITGQFTSEGAMQLANVLRFGALPLDFEPSQVESVSPTLGGEQLRVGLIAGILGLLIVALYALAYYRGLGFVVIGSLIVAAATTYASMVLLGAAVGFTLSLAAIAGAIVGIAVTADSFIIYFERIRDEVREGRSLRSAIQTGWKKARGTILIADCVSLLSAAVLYALAVGGVQGFAFALGLTTLIDLAIVFFFTKPLVSLLGRTKFFGEGHRMSGLSADHMGVSRQRLLGRRVRSQES